MSESHTSDSLSDRATHRILVLMPAYNEARFISDVVQHVLTYVPDVLVVDDGSSDDTADQAASAGAAVIRLADNAGKGAALNRGLDEAHARGFDAVITMDGDGQHAPEDLPAFIEAYTLGPHPVLIGNRMTQPGSMPLVRRWTNRIMSSWLSRLMNQDVPDTQNGFRLYGLDALGSCRARSQRYDAESEILLHLARNCVPIGSVPVATRYGPESSQIHPVRDTYRFLRVLYRYQRESKSALDRTSKMG